MTELNYSVKIISILKVGLRPLGHEVLRESIQTGSQDLPGIVLWKQHDGAAEFVDIDLAAFKIAGPGQSHGLTVAAFEELCCVHTCSAPSVRT